MRKIGSLSLTVGASVVAVTGGIFLVYANDKSQVDKSQVVGKPATEVADAGSVRIPDRPDWNWDVRPILSQNCFSCHGQGMQKAGLRLDIDKAAYDPIPEDKNKRAIVPGNPGKSELYKRIISTNADYRMPPKEAHKDPVGPRRGGDRALDHARRRLQAALGLHPAHHRQAREHQVGRPGGQRDRPLRLRQARPGGPVALV